MHQTQRQTLSTIIGTMEKKYTTIFASNKMLGGPILLCRYRLHGNSWLMLVVDMCFRVTDLLVAYSISNQYMDLTGKEIHVTYMRFEAMGSEPSRGCRLAIRQMAERIHLWSWKRRQLLAEIVGECVMLSCTQSVGGDIAGTPMRALINYSVIYLIYGRWKRCFLTNLQDNGMCLKIFVYLTLWTWIID